MIIKELISSTPYLSAAIRAFLCKSNILSAQFDRSIHDLISLDVVKKLSEQNDQVTALIISGIIGHIEYAKMFIKNGGDANFQINGISLITGIIAAKHANKQIRKHEMPTFRNHFGPFSVMNNLIKPFLKVSGLYGDGNSNNSFDGITMFHQYDELLNYIISINIDLNIRDEQGETALMLAIDTCQMDVVELLAKAGADLNITDSQGFTALMRCIQRGHTAIACYLISIGANINILNQENGYTALVLAIENNYMSVVEALILAGVDVNLYGNSDQVPILKASARGYLNFVIELTRAGACLSVQNSAGETALMLAVKSDNTDIVRHLLSRDDCQIQRKNSRGNCALMMAISQESLPIIRMLIDAGADVNEIRPSGRSILLEAIKVGNAKILHVIIQSGANLDVFDDAGETALMMVIRNNDSPAMLRALVEGGAALDLQDDFGLTALMIAIYVEKYESLKVLLEAGCNTNMQDKRGMTALMYSIQRNDLQLAELLLSSGADINIQNNDGYTALMLCVCDKDDSYINLLRLLVSHIGDTRCVNLQDDHGSTALMHAVRAASVEFVDILAPISSVNKQDNRGRTALALAATLGHLAIVKRLLRAFAYVAYRDRDGCSCLCLAVRAGHERVVAALIQAGASLEPQDLMGWTPLMRACSVGRVEIVRLLLHHGANLETRRSDNGRTALLIAVYRGKSQTVCVLIAAGANIAALDDAGMSPLLTAVCKGYVEIVHMLLNVGADVNLKTWRRYTPLTLAVDMRHRACVAALLHARADVSIIGPSTALIMAVLRGDASIIEMLLLADADVNQVDEWGRSPIMIAALHGRVDIASLLILRNANVHFQDYLGMTALMMACGANVDVFPSDDFYMPSADPWVNMPSSMAIITQLLDGGASLNTKDTSGYTALTWATRRDGFDDVVRLLLASGAETNHQDNLGKSVLMEAAERAQQENVRLLIAHGVDVNLLDFTGRTALTYLVSSWRYSLNSADEVARLSVLRMLLGAGITVDMPDCRGTTAFLEACGVGVPVIVEELLKAGCNVWHTDIFGGTAMHYTLNLIRDDNDSGCIQTAVMLLQRGQDLWAADNHGSTPMKLLTMTSAAVSEGVILAWKRCTLLTYSDEHMYFLYYNDKYAWKHVLRFL